MLDRGLSCFLTITCIHMSQTNAWNTEITILSSPSEDENLTDLHLIGLLPLGGDTYPFGVAQLPVYRWAAEDVGRMPGVLDGYRLVIHMGDTRVSYIAVVNTHTSYSIFMVTRS